MASTIQQLPDDATIRAITACGPEWLRYVVELLLSTCMSIGELCGTNERYSTNQGSRNTRRCGLVLCEVMAHVEPFIVTNYIDIIGKGNKSRTIALNATAREAILDLVRRFNVTKGGACLCPHSRTYVSAQFLAARKRADIEQHITLQTIRHCAIAKLVAAGHIKEAQLQAGHSDLRVTIGMYQMISPEQQHEAMKVLDND